MSASKVFKIQSLRNKLGRPVKGLLKWEEETPLTIEDMLSRKAYSFIKNNGDIFPIGLEFTWEGEVCEFMDLKEAYNFVCKMYFRRGNKKKIPMKDWYFHNFIEPKLYWNK